MSKEREVLIDEVLAREEFDRETIEDLRRRALVALKDREAIARVAASAGQEAGAAPPRKVGVALAVLGRYAEAAATLEAAAPSSPERLLLARCYRELGRFDEALAVLKGLSPDGCTRLDIDLELAGTEAAAGHAEEAMAVLERHKEAGQGRADYRFAVGCALEAGGDAEGAAAAYQAALEAGEHPEAAFRLGRLAERHGDDDLARSAYERCLSGAALYVNALINLGLLYEDLGNYQGAMDCYARALRLDPTNPRARLFLGDAEASLTMYIDEDLMRRTDRRNQVLETPVTDFELSVRSRNCLRKMGVRTLGDLAQCSEAELLAYKNFGETSLHEIRNLLTSKGLRLGMGKEAQTSALRRERPPSADAELLAKSADDLELSVRGRNCLQRLQIRTVGELVQCTETELLACRNFGQTSLTEIKTKLAELGLTLKES